ncbi:MAG: T9SS type A sorting domain-containing protein [Sphingobacteriales bacterium]|nr:MAG: T9SS type A sorting domain-containing protein [Sphingobacteriales bacterium]
MKYLFTIVSLLIAHCIAAQTYQPFPIGSGYWNYTATYHEYGAYALSNVQLASTNDIVTFNGKTYYKVKMRTSTTSGGSGFPPYPDNIADGGDGDFFAIREQDKRIYMTLNNSEFVLFDFNLSVGDMMPLASSGRLFGTISNDFAQTYSRITNIATTTVHDPVTGRAMQVKRFDLDNGAYVTEGIGGSFGLFLYTASYDARTLAFNCSRPGGDFCDYIWPAGTALAVEEVELTPANIYPNPFTSVLNIQSAPGNTIAIFDIAGRCVLQQTIGSRNVSIAVNDLAFGMYLIRFTAKDGSLVCQRKLIKE